MAIGCFAVMALVLTTAFRPEKELNDFWKQLGITKEEGDDKITEGFLRNVARSDNNPHGFLIERWRVLENKDLKTLNR